MGGRRGRRNENGALRRRREGVLQAVVAMYNDSSPHYLYLYTTLYAKPRSLGILLHRFLGAHCTLAHIR